MTTIIKRLRSWFAPAVIAAAASVVVSLAGLVVLIGGWLHLTTLTSISPNLPTTPPAAAVGLMLAGVALGVLRHEHTTRRGERFALACAAGVGLIGWLMLMDHAFGWDMGLDGWFGGYWDEERVAPSFHTALLFALVGPALLLVDMRPRRGPQPAQLLAVFVLHVVLLALLGQAFPRSRVLGTMAAVNDAGMSLPTALLGTILSAGILCARPTAGFMGVLLSRGGGGVVARRLLLVPIIAPLLVYLVALGALRSGLANQAFSIWLLVVAYFTTFTLIIWWVASVVRRLESERTEAENAVRRLNEELEQRVLERTAELAEANRELAHRNQENELFVYSVSHDLRSPLVNLLGFSKELSMSCQDLRALLDQDAVPPDVRRRGLGLVDNDVTEAVHFISTGVTRLSNIIDALLRLSRAGRVEYQYQAVNVPAVVQRIVASMAGTIHERGATVTVADLETAYGDPTALEQVFANLIGNALNYLDPSRPGHIDVGCMPAPGSSDVGVTYYVRDNGLGIPSAYQHKVFQAFQRLHPEVAQGEGMGLAIVRRVIERHRGKVWIESRPGAGSTFFVSLPPPPDKAPSQGGYSDSKVRLTRN